MKYERELERNYFMKRERREEVKNLVLMDEDSNELTEKSPSVLSLSLYRMTKERENDSLKGLLTRIC